MAPSPRISPGMVAGGRTLAEPRLAPDGRTLGFLASSRGGTDLVVVDLDGPERVVTTDPAPVRSHPSGGGTWDWLPDGSGVVYAGADGGLFRQAVAGGPPERLVDGARLGSVAVSPEGERVAYVVDSREVAVAPTAPGGA